MLTATDEILAPREKVLLDQAIAERTGRPGALLGILEEV